MTTRHLTIVLHGSCLSRPSLHGSTPLLSASYARLSVLAAACGTRFRHHAAAIYQCRLFSEYMHSTAQRRLCDSLSPYIIMLESGDNTYIYLFVTCTRHTVGQQHLLHGASPAHRRADATLVAKVAVPKKIAPLGGSAHRYKAYTC